MQYSDLYNKMNYLTPQFYRRGIIREFDIAKANISALLDHKAISKEEYDDLYNADKQYREIKIGLMIKNDKEVYKTIQKGIKSAKKMLFSTNNVQDHEIISIHNDAVMIAADRPFQTSFGLYNFVVKGEYSQFYHDFAKVEYYYNHDIKTNEDIIEIKGISQEKIASRPQEFLKFMIDIFYMLQTSGIEETASYFNEYIEKYVQLQLPIEAYRELNQDNMFRIKAGANSYLVDIITPNQLPSIFTGSNYAILRDLGTIIQEEYFTYKMKGGQK